MLVTDGFNMFNAIQGGKKPPQFHPARPVIKPTDWLLFSADESLPPKIVDDATFQKRFRIVGKDINNHPLKDVGPSLYATDEIVMPAQRYPWGRDSTDL